MNDIDALYRLWCEKVSDKELADDLKNIAADKKEIRERFWQNLAFGTGGLRGILGAGTNRMNIYTVCQATQGLCNYLNSDFEKPSVAIGYDSRINSDKFARAAAEVLAANGIKVYIFRELMPTPIVAYAVRELKCSSGIVITASHNPSKYNGYKCYDERGYQMTDAAAAKTLEFINSCDIFADVKRIDFDAALESGAVEYIENSFLEAYYEKVLSLRINPDASKNSSLSVIYTPLNGTGNRPVRRILEMMGIKDVRVVAVQEKPDGHFPTCSFPNPEIREAFSEAQKTAEKNPADLLLATDPDCDRVGIAVLSNGEYKLLTGNDVGCLLTYYILSQKKEQGSLSDRPVIVKSIVTSDMAEIIAESFDAEVHNVLTGFKYIGEFMTQLESEGVAERFELGFEESYGYLSGMHTRDKDAVNASMLICEMAAFYKNQGKTLTDVMNSLYERYGFWNNQLFNYYFEGEDGMKKMAAMMETLRANYPSALGGKDIARVTDYKTKLSTELKSGKTEAVTLPSSNVIVMQLENRDKVIVRPAGTEPKIKIYVMAQGKNREAAELQTQKYEKDITRILGIGE